MSVRPGPPPGARGASGRRSFRSTGKGSGAGPRGGQPRERKAAETVDKNNGNAALQLHAGGGEPAGGAGTLARGPVAGRPGRSSARSAPCVRTGETGTVILVLFHGVFVKRKKSLAGKVLPAAPGGHRTLERCSRARQEGRVSVVCRLRRPQGAHVGF